MATKATSPDQALKRLRELLPDNGKDIPDEFIITILESCNQDLNRSFEELQERLARASWESVEKAKKKKSDKLQNGHAANFSNDRRRGPTNSRFDGPRTSNGFSGGKENYNASSYRGRNGAIDSRGTPGSKTAAKPTAHETPALSNRTSAPAVVEHITAESKIERAPPPPCTNQWAKGRPQVVPEVPKWTEHVPIIAHKSLTASSKPVFEDIPSTLENDDSRPPHDANADSGSSESSQTEDTVAEGTEPSVVSEAVDFSKTASPDELLECRTAEQRDSGEVPLATDAASVGAVPSVESATSEMDALKLGYPVSQTESAPHSHHVHPSEQVPPSSAAAPAGPEHLPAAQSPLSQDAYSSQASYSQYAAYQQQYQPPQQQYAGVQDPSAFNASKMYYNGVNEMLGQSTLGMDGNSNRSGASNYSAKVPAQKQQHQQQQGLGWQSPMMNSYGMMTPNMYMTPQQMQMMYMQTYGMGMYGPNAINAQLYNNGSGYAAHQAFAGSKGQFNQAGAHKKQGAYGGAFGQQGFGGPSYVQPGRSEDQFKFQRGQGAQGADSFDSSYPYSYSGMSLPFDGNMSSHLPTQQGYSNLGRCANVAGGGVTVDESQYRSPFFGQSDATQGQWIGGN